MNILTLFHFHKHGWNRIDVNTNFTYEDLDNVIGQWFGASDTGSADAVYDDYQKSACKKLCDALNINFEPWNEGESLELHQHNHNIVDLDEKFPTLPQDDV